MGNGAQTQQYTVGKYLKILGKFYGVANALKPSNLFKIFRLFKHDRLN